MNDVSESHTEADNIKSIQKTRTKLKIGCWNVRTMHETGKQAQVIREMRAYKLYLVGISECR
jgi:mRNA-degrading endonuclease toxin of MazEF toxin-antitoxin module